MADFDLLRFMDRAEWMADSNCRGSDPNLFFPHPTEFDVAAKAKAICRACDVQAECLAYALNNNEDGIWGGTSERERRRIRRAAAGKARGPIPPPGELARREHGTVKGWRQHHHHGDETCQACRSAYAIDQQFRRPSRSVSA